MSKALKPWYAVATPHEDIREGRLDEAVFAANVWAVEQDTAPEIYLDPEEFFRKTFMTTGLKTILARVAGALRGDADAGARILSLQTAFGGGKTHTLVALRHLAKHTATLRDSPHAEPLRAALAGKFPESLNVAVFTNASCDPTQGRNTPEGIHTHTLWGELALQLGGVALYERIRDNDKARRVPQGLFVDILRAAAPCLILLDELADYCVGAAAVPVGNTTLADQTISFVQQLTEAVQQVPGTVVVATLPASKYEVAQSEAGQAIFATLEKRFQRLGADIKPIADDEIYEVVRARLFETISPPDDPDYPKRAARAYQQMYAAHKQEVPSETAKPSYHQQIERAYPFHPLMIDVLSQRWGSHPDFQRTRGVLRLLGAIVGDLWQRRQGNTQTQHLIQPCHINWSIDAVQAALTRFWGPAYQAVAAADVIGASSHAGKFDEERGGDHTREGIGRGLAAAALFGSFGSNGEHSGFSSKDIKLACSRHGLNWSYTEGALLELEQRCFYLHSTAAGSLGKRYWFGAKPTLNKLVVQYRQQIANADFEAEILDDLRTEARNSAAADESWRVIVAPEQSLPEQRSLTLLVLPPALVWDDVDDGGAAVKQCVLDISQHCGSKDRVYQNTLLFLASTTGGLNKLRSAHRERSALRSVREDYGDQLDEEQRDDLENRLVVAERMVREALGPARTVVLRVDQDQEVEACVLTDARTSFGEHLGYVWRTLVEDEEWILRIVGSVTLRDTGIIPEAGGLRLKKAVEAFLRFTDKPMVATREAVTAGLAQACKDGFVGIARGGDLSSLHARYCGESIDLDPSEEGVWVIPPFTKPEPGQPEGGTGGGEDPGWVPRGGRISDGDSAAGDAGSPDDEEGAADEAAPKSFVRGFTVQGSVPIESWTEIFRCFVNPATRMHLKRLQLGIQFEMKAPDDGQIASNDPTLKAMKESAQQLGLEMDIDTSEDEQGKT